jgi:hypothetical protein
MAYGSIYVAIPLIGLAGLLSWPKWVSVFAAAWIASLLFFGGVGWCLIRVGKAAAWLLQQVRAGLRDSHEAAHSPRGKSLRSRAESVFLWAFVATYGAVLAVALTGLTVGAVILILSTYTPVLPLTKEAWRAEFIWFALSVGFGMICGGVQWLVAKADKVDRAEKAKA